MNPLIAFLLGLLWGQQKHKPIEKQPDPSDEKNQIDPQRTVAELQTPIPIRVQAETSEHKSKWDKTKPFVEIVGVLAVVIYAIITYCTWQQIDDTAKRQLRPYLLYETGKARFSQDGRSYTVFIEIKNYGQTPAYSVRTWFTSEIMATLGDPWLYFCPASPSDDPVVKKMSGNCKSTVQFEEANGTEGSSDIGSQQSICVQKEFRVPDRSLLIGNKTLYVWGEVRYTDQFRSPIDQQRRNQYEAFVRQGSVSSSEPLQNIIHWMTDPEDDARKFPWPEKKNITHPLLLVLQGPCPR